MKNIAKIILVDADVISHFINGGHPLTLYKIFPEKKYVLSIVVREIRRHPKLRIQIDKLIEIQHLIEIQLPTDPQILKEFSLLRSSGKGDGESGCMALARFSKDIIASNNWTDVKKYCDLHGIVCYSTLDFIYEAYTSGVMTLSQCDYMIYNLLSLATPAKLPFRSLEEYCKNKGFPTPEIKAESA